MKTEESLSQNPIPMRFIIRVSTSGTGIDLDADSSENTIHDNVIIEIPDPTAALSIEDGAETENTLYSNTLMSSRDGQVISLDEGRSTLTDSSIVLKTKTTVVTILRASVTITYIRRYILDTHHGSHIVEIL
jgi:hypothetical protein